MTKKHMEMMARIIRNYTDPTPHHDALGKSMREHAANHAASCFKLENSRFDEERFFKACGLA
jgi:hypothetical protein